MAAINKNYLDQEAAKTKEIKNQNNNKKKKIPLEMDWLGHIQQNSEQKVQRQTGQGNLFELLRNTLGVF